MHSWTITQDGKEVGTVHADDASDARGLAEAYCHAQGIFYTRFGLSVNRADCDVCGGHEGECDDCGADDRCVRVDSESTNRVCVKCDPRQSYKPHAFSVGGEL